jgi:hypothetical protein
MLQNEVISQRTNTLHSIITTERVGIVVTLHALILEVFGSYLSRYSDYPDGDFLDFFPSFPLANAGVPPRFIHDRFLSDPLN